MLRLPNTETCRAARDAIDDLLYEDESPHRTFVPVDRLRAYLRPDKIREILSCICSTCLEDLRALGTGPIPPDFVSRIGEATGPINSRKTFYSVFGLLIHTEHPLFIVGFVDYNCNDYVLESLAARSILTREYLQKYTGEYKRDVRKYDRFAKRFLAGLFQFAVPHLKANGFSHFRDRTIMPFIEEKEIRTRTAEDVLLPAEGDIGRVFAFKIYREYNFPDFDSRMEYVRKRIMTPNPQAFFERSNIQYVQQFGDDHIVELIKAYGHGESINFILPRMWTNLDHLLRDPAFDYESKRGSRLETADAWKQLLGISNALKKMHSSDKVESRAWTRPKNNNEGRICIHLNLKPDNILVESNGTWLITDFGQAALTQSRRDTESFGRRLFNTDAYAAPEIEDPSTPLDRVYDIWSLGCIALEVVAFMVYGYVGLNGTTTFTGLDQARKSMPPWSRISNERFFYQESPGGEYVVKEQIQSFRANLETSHARATNSSAASVLFVSKIMDLIDTMLETKATRRTDISRVVDILSSAMEEAMTDPVDEDQSVLNLEPGEIDLGGRRMDDIEIWHYHGTGSKMRLSSLGILYNDADFLRLCCVARGQRPINVSFRRSDAKIVPFYAFWDEENALIEKTFGARTWIEFLFHSSGRCSKVPSSRYSFDGNSALYQARLVQSIVTSQKIVDSFNLKNLRLQKPLSRSQALKGFFRKTKVDGFHESTYLKESSSALGSATIQVWVEQDFPRRTRKRRNAINPQTLRTLPLQPDKRDVAGILPRRIVIYLHRQGSISTIKIDTNWVVEESKTNQRVLFFKPLPTGRNRTFRASWLRPTPEELDDEEQYPAGIPLDPRALQYYEDLDSIEVEDIELLFFSAEDRDSFKRTYLSTKRDWDLEHREAALPIEVNRASDGNPQPPDSFTHLPIPKKRVPLLVNPRLDKLSPPLSPSNESYTLPQDLESLDKPRQEEQTEAGLLSQDTDLQFDAQLHREYRATIRSMLRTRSTLRKRSLEPSRGRDEGDVTTSSKKTLPMSSAAGFEPDMLVSDVRRSVEEAKREQNQAKSAAVIEDRQTETTYQPNTIISDKPDHTQQEQTTTIRKTTNLEAVSPVDVTVAGVSRSLDGDNSQDRPLIVAHSVGSSASEPATPQLDITMSGGTDQERQQEALASIDADDELTLGADTNGSSTLVDDDNGTVYSLDDVAADTQSQHIQSFASLLMRDVADDLSTHLKHIDPLTLGDIVRMFARRLYEESADPFQWETSVILHRKQIDIVRLLTSSDLPMSDKPELDDIEEEVEPLEEQRKPFVKPTDYFQQWAAGIPEEIVAKVSLESYTEPHSPATELTNPYKWNPRDSESKEPDPDPEVLKALAAQQQYLQQSAAYETFVGQSSAYKWLVTSLTQCCQMSPNETESMLAIRKSLNSSLRKQQPLRTLSRRKPSAVTELTVKLDWSPIQVAISYGFKYPYTGILDRLFCLTGSQDQAQVSTVEQYMTQIWPTSSTAVLHLISQLLSEPEGHRCSYQMSKPANLKLTAILHYPSQCLVTVTSGPSLVSEIVEQLGWLYTALQVAPHKEGIAVCCPSIAEVSAKPAPTAGAGIAVVAECRLRVTLQKSDLEVSAQHLQQVPLRLKPFLIYGYPALRDAKVSRDHEFGHISSLICPLCKRSNDLDILRLQLPEVLRTVLNSTPKSLIEVHQRNNISIVDDLKLALEDHTGCLWDWTPLKAPRQKFPLGMSRIEWLMYGHRLQMQVTEDTALLLKDILSIINEHPDLCHCCKPQAPPLSFIDLLKKVVRLGAWHTYNRMGWISHTNQSTSSAAQSYTPTKAGSSGVAIPKATLQIRGRQSGAQPSPQPTVPSKASTGNLNPGTQPPCHYVLFAVKGFRWSWELEYIPMTSLMSDSTFFRALRSHHRGHRRAYLHWASPYRFKNCRYVKLEVFEPHRILAGTDQALPEDYGQAADYEYAPRPPIAKVPLIDPRTYAILLSECEEDCWWRVLPSHECIRFRVESSHRTKIPRKRDDIEHILNAGEGMAFGIEADHVLSYAILGVYHLVTIIPAFIFWAYWLSRHPDDWQNASVPLLTILALVTVFWLMIGKKAGIS